MPREPRISRHMFERESISRDDGGNMTCIAQCTCGMKYPPVTSSRGGYGITQSLYKLSVEHRIAVNDPNADSPLHDNDHWGIL